MIIPTAELANYLADKTQYDYRGLVDIDTKHLVVLSIFNSTLLTIQATNFKYVELPISIIKHLQLAECQTTNMQVSPKDININFAMPWIYKLNNSRWEKATLDSLTQDTIDRYYLTQQKAIVLDNIYATINSKLTVATTDNYLQDIIYSIKYQQAKDVLAELVDPIREPGHCSMVVNYADLMGLTLTEAANEIITQHKLYVDLLAEQEHFRLKFIKQVKEADNIDKLFAINNSLIKETFWYYRG